MRLLVTGAGGLVGSNLASAAAQKSWSVLGTWWGAPVSVPGVRTAPLDVSDRRACTALAEELEPDVVLHAVAQSALGGLEREPHLAELDLLATGNTLAAARTVGARYVLASSDLVFSGLLPSGECWREEDPTEPPTALGRSLLACERLVQRSGGAGWLITRPAEPYGINLSIPTANPGARARHIWERSGPALRWVARLRAGHALAAPPDIRRTPTNARDYSQRVCDLLVRECEGTYNTAGPMILGRLAHLRLLARAFACDMRLVREGPPEPFLPANTALCDRRANLALGRPAVDPFTGYRLMRRQLEGLLEPLEGVGEPDPPRPQEDSRESAPALPRMGG
jgi:dTDP-4-dehydrorhamnose reductase